jgi:phosphate:Na+ symporter
MRLLRRLTLPIVFALLAYAFWVSSDIKQIAAGVAIFLFGMLALEDGFQRLSGGFIERFLRWSTDSLWKSLNFGIITTTLMQSSSLVSVLTISFLSAGLIDLFAGIGIIFGANIGTTTGAWLVAGFGLKVNLSAYAMPMLVFGIILNFQKSKTLKGIGWILAGVGFLFLGIHYMKEGFDAFKDTIDLTAYAVPGIAGLLLFTLIGMTATVIMQSSHATLVLIITALAAQQITYENALALSIGANVGTTITAIIGSLSANISGKRLAGAHLIFNVVTGLVAILFIRQFLWGVEAISEMAGIADDDYTLKLAVFHTLFNVAGVIIMLPLINWLVRILEKFFREPITEVKQPKYLNDAALESGPAAVEVARKEAARLYDLASTVIAHGIGWYKHDLLDEPDIDHLVERRPPPPEDINTVYETRIKRIYSAIIEFVIKARETVTGKFGENLQVTSRAAREIVAAIKSVKHLQKNLLHYLQSDSETIVAAYNHLRLKIALVMRQIEEVRKMEDPIEATLALDEILLYLEEDTSQVTENVEELLRNGSITPEMGTSLMTDSDYAYMTCKNLVAVAKMLFTREDAEEQQIEIDLALTDDEMAEIIRSSGNESN